MRLEESRFRCGQIGLPIKIRRFLPEGRPFVEGNPRRHVGEGLEAAREVVARVEALFRRPLRSHDHDARRRVRAVQAHRGGVLEHLYLPDGLGGEAVQVPAAHPVHDVYRLDARDDAESTDVDRRPHPRRPGRGYDLHARLPADQLVQRVRPERTHVLKRVGGRLRESAGGGQKGYGEKDVLVIHRKGWVCCSYCEGFWAYRRMYLRLTCIKSFCLIMPVLF